MRGGGIQRTFWRWGVGDFSPQNILEGIGWEVGTSYSQQGGLADGALESAWHTPRPGQPERAAPRGEPTRPQAQQEGALTETAAPGRLLPARSRHRCSRDRTGSPSCPHTAAGLKGHRRVAGGGGGVSSFPRSAGWGESPPPHRPAEWGTLGHRGES